MEDEECYDDFADEEEEEVVGVEAVAFHEKLPILATTFGNTTKLWLLQRNNTEAKLVETLEGHEDSVVTLAFHPVLPILATGSQDNSIKLWRVEVDATGSDPKISSTRNFATLDGHSSSVYSVAFHPSAPLLVSASADNTVKLWR